MAFDQCADLYTQPTGPGQLVAYTTSAAIANPLPPNAEFVWVWTTTAAYIKVAKGTPTATNADFPLPANWPVKIALPGNDGTYKVAALQETTGGNLHVCPVAY